jgi:hypothetical protein
MVGVACSSLVDIESLILRSAEGASRRMVQKQRDRRWSALRGRYAAPQGEVRTSAGVFHVKQADARDEI